MLAAILLINAVKLAVTLPAIFLALWGSTKLFEIRFATQKTTIKLTFVLAVIAFTLDLVNIYVVLYAAWSNLVKSILLVGFLMFYCMIAFILIWAVYRDTNKKSVIMGLIYAAAYILVSRVYGLYIADILAWVGVELP